MSRPLLVLVALLLLAGAGAGWLSRPRPGFAFDEPLTYTARSIGPPESGSAVEIWRPQGPGPFPTVVLLHGSGGVEEGDWQWARRLVDWGYAAVILDSYRARCGRVICGHSRIRSPVSSATRADDLANLLPFLQHQPGIDGSHIAAIGFSQGSAAALIEAIDDPKRPPRLRALVAYYTACRVPPGARLAVDTIMLVGSQDRIAQAQRCSEIEIVGNGPPHKVPVKVFAGVGHNFDREDIEVARESIADTKAFLAAHLR
jgi:dienelactone hydrolase